jgi:hypothetical protein
MLHLTALMMEAVITSETSVIFCQTSRCYIPDKSHLHIRRRQNLKPVSVNLLMLVLVISNALLRADSGDCMFLRNGDIYLKIHTSILPRRPTPTSSVL